MKLAIVVSMLALFGCESINETASRPAVSGKDYPDTDRINMKIEWRTTRDYYYEVDVILELAAASRQAYGINIPVWYDTNYVYVPDEATDYERGDAYDCEELEGDTPAIFVDMEWHIPAVWTSHIMWLCNPGCWWTCDQRDNDLVVLRFLSKEQAHIAFGMNSWFDYGTEMTAGDMVKVRDDTNHPLPFVLYKNGRRVQYLGGGK